MKEYERIFLESAAYVVAMRNYWSSLAEQWRTLSVLQRRAYYEFCKEELSMSKKEIEQHIEELSQ